MRLVHYAGNKTSLDQQPWMQLGIAIVCGGLLYLPHRFLCQEQST